METRRQPCLKSLSQRGYIQGVTLCDKSTDNPLCHYFGGLRYGLPPAQRWRKARKLPSTYTYGTEDHPCPCEGPAGVCPQPSFLNLSKENGWSEDCFQCNVWVPSGEPPKEGWPVLFFIHGGFLQFGTPNTFSAAGLLGEGALNAVIVMPAYRLGVFGFLYSSELENDASTVGEAAGNQGFWDQRLALEWTKDNISLFGGNPSQITVAGYSAGAYSAFYQLAYDVNLPEEQAVVKQACIWSNGPATQPKNPAAAQVQFNQLLSALNIPAGLPGPEKIARLRAVPSSELLSAAVGVDINQFRPTTDSGFIPSTLFQSFDDGSFGRRVASRNIRIMLGECRDERFLYATWFPPPENTLASLRKRLLADYPRPVADTLLKLYYPDGNLPTDCEDWNRDAFGRIYADMQVHKMQRGLVHSLALGGASHLLYRYRVEYRLQCVDKSIPPAWGVTHATDQYIWFWGNGEVIEPREKPVVRKALIDPWIKFVHGETDLDWGTRGHREMRTLKADGSVQIWQDELWDEAMRVWKALRDVGEPEETVAKL